jgi:HEAT repeats
MNSLIVGVMAIVAGILAAVLFGRPQGDRTTPIAPITTVVPLPPADRAERNTSIATLPITELPARSQPPEPLTASPAARAAAMSTIGNAPSSAMAPSMPPFAAIQDPKRPSTPLLQDLSQEIINLGTAQKLSNVPKLLQHRHHADPLIRCYVAHAIGQIAAAHTIKSETQATIPFLGELAIDADATVRQMALKALSRIQSPDVLPYLEKGQLTATGATQQLAIAAIQKLKAART